MMSLLMSSDDDDYDEIEEIKWNNEILASEHFPMDNLSQPISRSQIFTKYNNNNNNNNNSNSNDNIHNEEFQKEQKRRMYQKRRRYLARNANENESKKMYILEKLKNIDPNKNLSTNDQQLNSIIISQPSPSTVFNETNGDELAFTPVSKYKHSKYKNKKRKYVEVDIRKKRKNNRSLEQTSSSQPLSSMLKDLSVPSSLSSTNSATPIYDRNHRTWHNRLLSSPTSINDNNSNNNNNNINQINQSNMCSPHIRDIQLSPSVSHLDAQSTPLTPLLVVDAFRNETKTNTPMMNDNNNNKNKNVLSNVSFSDNNTNDWRKQLEQLPDISPSVVNQRVSDLYGSSLDESVKKYRKQRKSKLKRGKLTLALERALRTRLSAATVNAHKLTARTLQFNDQDVSIEESITVFLKNLNVTDDCYLCLIDAIIVNRQNLSITNNKILNDHDNIKILTHSSTLNQLSVRNGDYIVLYSPWDYIKADDNQIVLYNISECQNSVDVYTMSNDHIVPKSFTTHQLSSNELFKLQNMLFNNYNLSTSAHGDNNHDGAFMNREHSHSKRVYLNQIQLHHNLRSSFVVGNIIKCTIDGDMKSFGNDLSASIFIKDEENDTSCMAEIIINKEYILKWKQIIYESEVYGGKLRVENFTIKDIEYWYHDNLNTLMTLYNIKSKMMPILLVNHDTIFEWIPNLTCRSHKVMNFNTFDKTDYSMRHNILMTIKEIDDFGVYLELKCIGFQSIDQTIININISLPRHVWSISKLFGCNDLILFRDALISCDGSIKCDYYTDICKPTFDNECVVDNIIFTKMVDDERYSVFNLMCKI